MKSCRWPHEIQARVMAHALLRGTELRDAQVQNCRSQEMRCSSVRAQRKRQSEGYWGSKAVADT